MGDLLESIIKQTKLPDEIVFVDGGSSDNTIKMIELYKNSLPIKLIISNGANIAKGRNIAIKLSTNDIIASIDGGCKIDSKWLEKITDPLEQHNYDIVSGVYLPWYITEFEEIASHLIFPDINNLKSFLPSARSMAYRKAIWEKVGGYPEWLDYAEDTYFDLICKKNDANFILEKDAIVYWRVRKNIRNVFRQFFFYAKGDGIELLFPIRYITRYATVVLLVVLLLIGYNNLIVWLFFIIFSGTTLWIKHLRKVPNLNLFRFILGLKIAFAIEFGNIFGYFVGLLSHKRGERKINARLPV